MPNKPTTIVLSIASKSFPAEFTGTLVKLLHEQIHQQVWETLMESLEALKAPDEVKRLVIDLEALTLHYELFSSQSEGDHPEVMDVITQAAQDIADVGGKFDGRRRDGTFLALAGIQKAEG